MFTEMNTQNLIATFSAIKSISTGSTSWAKVSIFAFWTLWSGWAYERSRNQLQFFFEKCYFNFHFTSSSC